MRQEQPLPSRWIFWAIFAILVFDRAQLLARFGFQYTDNDQVIFWMGARDYSHGIFHEPCLYGQNYNYMLESLLAAPFFRLGIPPWNLFPLVTSALALAPYLAFAFYFLKRNLLTAIVFLAIPILLPPEFGMLTTMSRGFFTGLCFLALFPLIDRLHGPVRFLAVGAAGGLALVMNPNAAPAIVVLILVRQLENPHRLETWLYPLFGAAPFLALNYLASIYYSSHPPIHSLSAGMMIFNWSLFLDGVQHLDRHFAWLVPLFWNHGSFILVLLFALTCVLTFKRRWGEAVALLIGIGIMIGALGTPKIHDGADLITYPYSRMFLAAPLLLGIGFSFCGDFIKNKKPAVVVVLFICAGVAVFKAGRLKATLREQTAERQSMVELRPVEQVRRECEAIKALCRDDVGVIVALPPLHCSYADASFYCVGGEMIVPDYPRTLIYGFERRAWRTETEMATVTSNLLFIGGGRQGWRTIEQTTMGIINVGDENLMIHRVRNWDGLPLRELMRKLKPVMQMD